MPTLVTPLFQGPVPMVPVHDNGSSGWIVLWIIVAVVVIGTLVKVVQAFRNQSRK